MFKRSEKKIKAIFKMQFKATQVPQLKAKSLMISLVPVGVGKPTVRLPKSPIIEGTCTWESPVYETLKLVQETKTGQIREKFYYVIVSTGSSKSGFLGEVSIDFADLSEATKPLNLTLPLQTSKSGAILHVTVQRMQGGPDSRHDDDSEAPEDESYDRNLDTEGRDSYSFGKRNPKSPESDDLSEVSTLHDEQNVSLEDGVSDNYDAESRDGVKETSNDMFGRLTSQMKMFERKAELSELEVQSLRKQITKETSRGQQLSDQLVRLKEERDVLKAELERHKSPSTTTNSEAGSGHTPKDAENLISSLEKTKQDLQRHKDWNKKLKLQVQKAEDSNSEFVLAMRDLSKKLDQKNTEISRLSSKIKALHSGSDALEASPRTMMNLNEESRAIDESETLKQKIDELYSQIEVHKKEKNEIRMDIERLNLDYESLETENKDIYAKLEQSENEKMEIKQNYIDSSATERNLKLQVATLEAENKRQALQYSESLNMIDELEFQIESLQKEFEKQAEIFQDDLEAVTEAKVEQEQRAVRAEEALRKTKLSSRNTAERLQEEFTQISAEMALKIEENEILAQEAVTEANDLHQKNEVLEELLQKAKEELQIIRDQYENILREHTEMTKQKTILGEESEQMKTTIMEESETLHRWKSEKEDLERQLASVRKEAEKLTHENVSMKSQIDLKKTKEENLLLEVKKLRLKNNEVKNLMLELQLEKEGLKKEKSKLQESLRKKEQEREKAALSLVKEKNIKHNTKAVGINVETNRLQTIPAKKLEQESMPAEQISSLLSEVASLKERNKGMEEELKDMRERYSEISLRFAEVEGERQQLVMTLRNLKSGKKN
ncbi:hypothetical protein PHJA_000364700 [Phtheirospermum japonicum]|uniref:C2 NT-type domain-containing protein n=1 Tax=Phtheirospermum japonicum TaxID=374723 RepID=A0A830BE27_9LAMI|nr:hypothetical protein PHJA_000364700 [Phtheirospermum japonicum]